MLQAFLYLLKLKGNQVEAIEVKENLCIRDKNNPCYDVEGKLNRWEGCMCDNCFYGRDELAQEIIKLWSIV